MWFRHAPLLRLMCLTASSLDSMVSLRMYDPIWFRGSRSTCLVLNTQGAKRLIRLHSRTLLTRVARRFVKAMYREIFSGDSAKLSGTLLFTAIFRYTNQSSCSSGQNCSMYSIIQTLGSPVGAFRLAVLDYQVRPSMRASLLPGLRAPGPSIPPINLEGLARFTSRCNSLFDCA